MNNIVSSSLRGSQPFWAQMTSYYFTVSDLRCVRSRSNTSFTVYWLTFFGILLKPAIYLIDSSYLLSYSFRDLCKHWTYSFSSQSLKTAYFYQNPFFLQFSKNIVNMIHYIVKYITVCISLF